jgi:hypothetical protein
MMSDGQSLTREICYLVLFLICPGLYWMFKNCRSAVHPKTVTLPTHHNLVKVEFRRRIVNM